MFELVKELNILKKSSRNRRIFIMINLLQSL